MIGVGGAPVRESTLPEDPTERKRHPVASGVLDYFPDALVALARVSWQGNEQHNPGQPLHWAREKSTDEADALLRHFMRRGTTDSDGLRHTAKMAWRALALLQKEIEGEPATGAASEGYVPAAGDAWGDGYVRWLDESRPRRAETGPVFPEGYAPEGWGSVNELWANPEAAGPVGPWPPIRPTSTSHA